MAFDLASAKPVGAAQGAPAQQPSSKKKGSFDIASARAVASGQPEYDPTSGMTPDQLFAVGMGKAFVDLGHGAQQAWAGIQDFASPRQLTTADLVAGRRKPLSRYEQLQQEEAARRELDAPLMRKGWATAGNLTGNLAIAAPTMMIPGATTLTGGAAIGTGFGLLTPTVEGESRVQNAAVGGALGVAAPLALRGVNRLYNAVKALRNPNIAAENALAERAGEGPEVTNALAATQGAETTPGFQPTLTERLFSQGVQRPGLSALEADIRTASGPLNQKVLEASNVRLTALQDQLKRIEERMAQQRNAMTPAAYATLNDARQAILANIDQEQQALAAASQRAAGGLPSGVTQPGQQLTERAGTLERGVRENVTTPAYTAAFNSAGQSPIDPTRVITTVENILGQPLGKIDPNISRTARQLQNLQGRPVTLEELHNLRADVGADIAAARQAGADSRLAEFSQVRTAIDDAIASSNLSDEAKSLYGAATDLYRTEVGERFLTGLAKQLRGRSSLNESRILPENVVRRFLSGERGPRAFETLFRNDPDAAASMSGGIQALFRKTLEAVEPDKMAAAAQAFIRKNNAALTQLENNGVQARASLMQVQQDVMRNATGTRELRTLAAQFGDDNEQSFLRGLIASPSRMDAAMTRTSSAGQSAIASKVTDHVTQMMEADPEKALKFIADNRASISRALRGSGTAVGDLESAANNIIEFKKVQLPQTPIGETVLDITQNFTDDQLHSLALVAEDVKNMKGSMQLANYGRPVESGAAGQLGQEEGGRTMNPNQIPGWFSAKIAAIKAGWSAAQGKVSDKALAKLFRYMYEDPDSAIEAILRGQDRLARKATTQRQLNALGSTASSAVMNTLMGKPRDSQAYEPLNINALAGLQ